VTVKAFRFESQTEVCATLAPFGAMMKPMVELNACPVNLSWKKGAVVV
jgi:hypothetical protein